jgi:Zn finger protein HypA/HybF involved in hydrogenase expression
MICNHCHEDKPESKFSKGHKYCKSCASKQYAVYYAKNREKILYSQHVKYAVSKGHVPAIQIKPLPGSVRKLCPECKCRVYVLKSHSSFVCPSCGASIRIIQALGPSNVNRHGIILRVEA